MGNSRTSVLITNSYSDVQTAQMMFYSLSLGCQAVLKIPLKKYKMVSAGSEHSFITSEIDAFP